MQPETKSIEELAEEFAERQRQGEHPTVEEYVDRDPQLADHIRELFPTLQFLEDLKPALPISPGLGNGQNIEYRARNPE